MSTVPGRETSSSRSSSPGASLDTTVRLQEEVVSQGQVSHHRRTMFDNRHISPVSFVNLHDLVATLNDNIGRYTSMTSLSINLTRLIMEDAAALSDAELDEVSCSQDDPIDEETNLGWLS